MFNFLISYGVIAGDKIESPSKPSYRMPGKDIFDGDGPLEIGNIMTFP